MATEPSSSTAPYHLSKSEKAAVASIRSAFDGAKIPIAADLDTDFNLLRWHRAYDGDTTLIKRNMTKYIEWRHAIGFDKPDHVETWLDDPSIKTTYKNFACMFMPNNVLDNQIICGEDAIADVKLWVRCIMTSDYHRMCLGFTEAFFQNMLRLEAKLGRPCRNVVLFNMENLKISEWLNPMTPHGRLWVIRANFWQDFYPEVSPKIYVLNSSRWISPLMTVAKFFIRAQNLSYIEFIKTEKLRDALHPSVVPKKWGGTLVDNSPHSEGDPESCFHQIQGWSEELRYTPGTIWRSHKDGADVPLTHEKIAYAHTFTVFRRTTKPFQVIRWQYWVSGTVEFGVRLVDEDQVLSTLHLNTGRTQTNKERHAQDSLGTMVVPQWAIITTKIPEEKAWTAATPGVYAFEFVNVNTMNALKLDYAVVVTDEIDETKTVYY